jgi:hypothetical protein
MQIYDNFKVVFSLYANSPLTIPRRQFAIWCGDLTSQRLITVIGTISNTNIFLTAQIITNKRRTQIPASR